MVESKHFFNLILSVLLVEQIDKSSNLTNLKKYKFHPSEKFRVHRQGLVYMPATTPTHFFWVFPRSFSPSFFAPPIVALILRYVLFDWLVVVSVAKSNQLYTHLRIVARGE